MIGQPWDNPVDANTVNIVNENVNQYGLVDPILAVVVGPSSAIHEEEEEEEDDRYFIFDNFFIVIRPPSSGNK